MNFQYIISLQAMFNIYVRLSWKKKNFDVYVVDVQMDQ